MSQIKAVVVDPFKKEVRIRMIDSSLQGLQKEVRGPIERAAELPNGDTVYVNENGLLQNYRDADGNEIDPPGFFCGPWNPGPLVGYSIIVGTTADGDHTNVSEDTLKLLYKYSREDKFYWVKVDMSTETFQRVK